MAVPLITQAVGALLRRYGLKELTPLGKKALRNRARERLAKKGINRPTKKQLDIATKRQRRRQVIGNIARDSLAGTAITYDIGREMELQKFKSEKELEKYIRLNYPKLYRKYRLSSYSSIKTFLKDQGIEV